MKWLKKLFTRKSPVDYRLLGTVNHKGEEKVREQILRSLNRRIKNGRQ